MILRNISRIVLSLAIVKDLEKEENQLNRKKSNVSRTRDNKPFMKSQLESISTPNRKCIGNSFMAGTGANSTLLAIFNLIDPISYSTKSEKKDDSIF